MFELCVFPIINNFYFCTDPELLHLFIRRAWFQAVWLYESCFKFKIDKHVEWTPVFELHTLFQNKYIRVGSKASIHLLWSYNLEQRQVQSRVCLKSIFPILSFIIKVTHLCTNIFYSHCHHFDCEHVWYQLHNMSSEWHSFYSTAHSFYKSHSCSGNWFTLTLLK